MHMQVIDERSKVYSYAGDDRVNQAITGTFTGAYSRGIVSSNRLATRELVMYATVKVIRKFFF